MNEAKIKLAQAMAVPHKNCREYQTGENMQEHTRDENCSHDAQIVVKSRAEGATTLTPEQLQQLLTAMGGGVRRGARVDPPTLTTEQILEKKKLQLQENAKQRRIRKSVKNKTLAVAESKHDRRLIERGATAQQLQTDSVATPHKRARTLRREATRNMAKLSRKFATKPAQAS